MRTLIAINIINNVLLLLFNEELVVLLQVVNVSNPIGSNSDPIHNWTLESGLTLDPDQPTPKVI